jgi:hypothetical protein
MIKRYNPRRNSNMYRDDVDGDYVTYADHVAAITPLVRALRTLVAVEEGVGEEDSEDSFETAAQTINDLDTAMNQARAVLAEYKEIA